MICRVFLRAAPVPAYMLARLVIGSCQVRIAWLASCVTTMLSMMVILFTVEWKVAISGERSSSSALSIVLIGSAFEGE